MSSHISGVYLLCYSKICIDKVVTLPLNVYLAILGAFVGILIGTLTVRVSEVTKIPNTLLLISIGLILGVTLYQNAFWFETFQPNTIPWVLLPPILLQSSSNMDIHVFSRMINQLLLLSLPGVIINSLLIGILIFWAGFTHDFNLGSDSLTNFLSCWMIGAIMSSTDPVSIIKLIREQSKERKISTILEGEAVINSGISIVLLQIILICLQSLVAPIGSPNHHSRHELAWAAAKLLVGGPAIGFIWA